MNLSEFHAEFRNHVQGVMAERACNPDEAFPQEELIFAELAMDDVSAAGISEAPEVCHWEGTIRNAKLRISGYSISGDDTRIDLFLTHYLGTDHLTQLRDSDVGGVAKAAVTFAANAGAGKLSGRLDPTSPVLELVETLERRWHDLDQLRVIVLTDGQTKSKHFSAREVEGRLIQVEAMDMERLFRHTTGKPRDEIAVSFEQAIGRPLPCVHVADPTADYDYALTAIPAEVLRALYERFNTTLLEANVRSFLGTRKKVNAGIMKTLIEEPGHFLAYNNGLVIVCDEAEFTKAKDGQVGISLMKGMQIVNGGQTTSSIYFSSRDNRDLDLSRVMIPAKVVILRDGEDQGRETLISRISQYANSQTAVKTSDLSANRAFHVEFEKLANETWCPDGTGRWFYERAAGAYAVAMLRDGRTKAQRKRLQEVIPTRRKLTKNDLAKYHESWRGLPNQVALGGEKNFVAFMAALDEEPGIVPDTLDVTWYKEMIAKVILFKAIEKQIKTKDAKSIFKQGYVNVASYTVAMLGLRLGDRLDLMQVWQRQDTSGPLSRLMWEWACVVNSVFNRVGAGTQFSELAKRGATWEAVQAARYPEFPERVPELRQMQEV
ncbi:AIPR protein [Thioclava sp. SK-1]|uniref:AIPR family protein n=1 Tax=Thioclava sp. SK-1 TaxID=1889770 RepID=UPI0008249523|nr:AIPR family protein [Thioclava sp. SK-1]OCX63162.1 AIPR protein [Thioclava sp. SK-1]